MPPNLAWQDTTVCSAVPFQTTCMASGTTSALATQLGLTPPAAADVLGPAPGQPGWEPRPHDVSCQPLRCEPKASCRARLRPHRVSTSLEAQETQHRKPTQRKAAPKSKCLIHVTSLQQGGGLAYLVFFGQIANYVFSFARSFVPSEPFGCDKVKYPFLSV